MEAQMRVQLLAVEAGLNLPGVGVADGGDHVGVGETALEHVGVLIALLEVTVLEDVAGQAGPVFHGGDVVDALEAQVMDGQHALGAADGRVGEERAQEHRRQRRLPVVAVDDVGDPVHVVERREGRLGKVAELGDVAHQIGVGIAPAEEFIIIDEIIDNAVHDHFHDADIEAAPVGAEIHLELAAVDHLLLVLLGDAGIAGQDDLHVAVLLGEGLGQGVHHVAQTAGLDEGIALGADEGDAAARLGQLRLLDGFLNLGILTHGLYNLLNGLFFCGFGDGFLGSLDGLFHGGLGDGFFHGSAHGASVDISRPASVTAFFLSGFRGQPLLWRHRQPFGFFHSGLR